MPFNPVSFNVGIEGFEITLFNGSVILIDGNEGSVVEALGLVAGTTGLVAGTMAEGAVVLVEGVVVLVEGVVVLVEGAVVLVEGAVVFVVKAVVLVEEFARTGAVRLRAIILFNGFGPSLVAEITEEPNLGLIFVAGSAGFADIRPTAFATFAFI